MENDTYTKWLRWSEKVHIVGQFENEHGERFVIYRNPTGDTPYITGDEFDWARKVNLIWGDFMLSEDERNEVAKIMWPTINDLMEKAKGNA